jgi:hypothetical protein
VANDYNSEGFISDKIYFEGTFSIISSAFDDNLPATDPKLIIFYAIDLPFSQVVPTGITIIWNVSQHTDLPNWEDHVPNGHQTARRWINARSNTLKLSFNRYHRRLLFFFYFLPLNGTQRR